MLCVRQPELVRVSEPRLRLRPDPVRRCFNMFTTSRSGSEVAGQANAPVFPPEHRTTQGCSRSSRCRWARFPVVGLRSERPVAPPKPRTSSTPLRITAIRCIRAGLTAESKLPRYRRPRGAQDGRFRVVFIAPIYAEKFAVL